MPFLVSLAGALLVLVAALGASPLGTPGPVPTAAQPAVDAKRHPVRAAVLADLHMARLPESPELLGCVSAVTGVGLAFFLWPLRNGTVLVLSLLAGAALPFLWVHGQATKRRRKVQQAMGQVLTQLAAVAQTHYLPLQALTAAIPSFPALIRAPFAAAMTAHEAGLPLPDALRSLAAELGGNFYAYQLGELAAVSIREGGSFADAVHQLAARYRTMEELKAEERTSLNGYYTFTRAFALASLAPMLWWVMTRNPSLSYFVEHPLPRLLAGWAFATALVFMALPLLLSVEDV